MERNINFAVRIDKTRDKMVNELLERYKCSKTELIERMINASHCISDPLFTQHRDIKINSSIKEISVKLEELKEYLKDSA